MLLIKLTALEFLQSKETANIINVLMDQCAMDEKVEKEVINLFISSNIIMININLRRNFQFVKFLRHLLFRMVKFTACDIISLDRKLLATVS